MTVELYVVLSICIIVLIYLNKSDQKEQKKKECQKHVSQKTLTEIKDMYFHSLKELDEMYREFQKRNS